MEETEEVELPADDITLHEMEALCKKCYELREKKEKLEDEVKEATLQLDKAKEDLLHVLNDLDKSSYDSAFGKVIVAEKFTVSMPKEPQAKKLFFEYLREKNVFEDLITVHSNTLNSFYKTELEIANKESRVEFSIPGLGEPFHKQVVTLRSKK